MRAIRHTLAVGLLATPALALAEPLPIQSGEHPNFSRLVALVRDAEWSISQSGREVVLSVPSNQNGFDVSGVFERMPKSHIAEVDATADQIKLTLTCDCAVSAFLEKDAYVVIDVSSDPSALRTPPLPSVKQSDDPQASSESPPIAEASAQAEANPTSVPRIQEATEFTSVGTVLKQALPLSASETKVVRQVESRLHEELAVAALRGVLTPVPGTDGRAVVRPQIALETLQLALPEAEEPEPAQPARPRANLRISSSRDLPATLRGANDTIAASGEICPTDDTLDIAAWGSSASFTEQIGTARDSLFDARDRLDHEKALQLARTYLYFGFGAEAQSTLALDPNLLNKNNVLVAMGDILDGRNLALPSPFSGLAECTGPTALWAVLALPDPAKGALPDSAEALRILNGLPGHLRRVLAPMLSQTLLAYGDSEGASAALRSIERLPTPLPPAAQLAKARVEIGKGEANRGFQRLSSVAEDNTQQSPEALVELVESKLARDLPISPEIASLVEAYASELRDAPIGPALRRAHVIALAKSGQFDRAYQASARLGGSEETEDAQELQKTLVTGQVIASACPSRGID